MIPETLQRSRSEPVDDVLLQEIVGKIVERFQPRRIILFGSRARGDHRRDSDLDLFVEMDTDAKPHERRPSGANARPRPAAERILNVRRVFAEADRGLRQANGVCSGHSLS